MKYRTFPKTDISVSEVGFGIWTIVTEWGEEHTEKEALQMLHTARDLGINFFDTADTYGNGYGEEILQKAFGKNPSDIVYATKFGYDIYSDIQNNGHSANADKQNEQCSFSQRYDEKFLRYACEQSLRRLGVDAIPIWQVHNLHFSAVQSDELWATVETLKDEGKVLHAGVAVGPANGWLAEGIAAMRHRDIATLQTIYNILEQHPGGDFFPDARARGIGLMVRVPHSSGMLEGHYTANTIFSPQDYRCHHPHSWLINGIKKIETLKFLTEGRQQTLGQASIKFILTEPSVTTVLPNIYSCNQLREFATAPDLPDLTDRDLRKIAALEAVNFGVYEEPIHMKGDSMSVLNEWEAQLQVVSR